MATVGWVQYSLHSAEKTAVRRTGKMEGVQWSMKLLADRIHDPITVMSSDVCPAGCVGSHQSPAPREINTVEHQLLLAESPSSILPFSPLLPSFLPSYFLYFLPKLHDPQTYTAIPSPSRTGHCFNQSEGEAPGSCFWGLIDGSSFNSLTWSKWLLESLTLWWRRWREAGSAMAKSEAVCLR